MVRRTPISHVVVAFALALFGLSRVADSAQSAVGISASGAVQKITMFDDASNADIGASGATLVVGPVNLTSILSTNGATGNCFLQLYDATSPPSPGAVPTWTNTSVSSPGNPALIAFSGRSIALSTGVTIACSTTQWTFTAPTVTTGKSPTRVLYHL
jgi:hypothetical protein